MFNPLLPFRIHIRRIVANLYIKPLSERPQDIKEVMPPRLHGKVMLMGGLEDIEGMSGGPVFALGLDDNEMPQYWIEGVQSKWVKSSQHVAVCRIGWLINKLRNEVGN